MDWQSLYHTAIDWLATAGLRLLAILVLAVAASKLTGPLANFIFSVRMHEHFALDKK
jgi:hypothetical protein